MDYALSSEAKLRRPRLLWVGDAKVKSGFARVNHSVNAWLHKIWDVECLGIGYDGDPHDYPYRIRPAKKYSKGDMFGISRFVDICGDFEPDVVLMNTDSYAICGFLEESKKIKNRPIMVAYSPVDTPGVKSAIIKEFQKNQLDLFISYTDFGAKEIRKAGWHGLISVIPHGVDTGFYKPYNREDCRKQIAPGIPPGSFVVGAVNRNQPRKRLDLTVIYFAEWLKRGGDGVLWLHCAKKDAGWDLIELATQLGIQDRVFMPGVAGIEDMPEEVLMPLFYSMLDVQVSTTLGEGWGLTTMEGMACGVPQIVPDWSALAEWTGNAVIKVPCSSVEILSGYHTFGIGGIIDQDRFIDDLDEVASSPMLREEMTRAGLELVSQNQFKWKNIAEQFHFNLAGLLATRESQHKYLESIKPKAPENELSKLAEAVSA